MGNVYQTGPRGMKDRVGECWFMPAMASNSSDDKLTDQFLVIVDSVCKGKYFVHTFISTHSTGKFEFKTMREWTMIPLETSIYKRVG